MSAVLPDPATSHPNPAFANLPTQLRARYASTKAATDAAVAAVAGPGSPGVASAQPTPPAPAAPAAAAPSAPVQPVDPAAQHTQQDEPPKAAAPAKEGQATGDVSRADYDAAVALGEKYKAQWSSLNGRFSVMQADLAAAQAEAQSARAERDALKAAQSVAAPAPTSQQHHVSADIMSGLTEEERGILSPEFASVLQKVVANATRGQTAPVIQEVQSIRGTLSEQQATAARQSEQRFQDRLHRDIPHLATLVNDPLWGEFLGREAAPGVTNMDALRSLNARGTMAQSDEDRIAIAAKIKKLVDVLHAETTPVRPRGIQAAPSSAAAGNPDPQKKPAFKMSEYVAAGKAFRSGKITAAQMQDVTKRRAAAIADGSIDDDVGAGSS